MAGGTTVYSVSHGDGTFYVALKDEALRLARELRAGGDLYVGVTRQRVTTRLRRRELFVALLNSEGWAEPGSHAELDLDTGRELER